MPNYESIPTQLREPALWLQYYPSPNPKRPDKKPSKHPEVKYGTPEERKSNLRSLDYLIANRTLRPGGGYQRWADPSEKLTYIDLDHCRNPETGAITEEAQAIINVLDTFTEISESGTGLHLVCRAGLAADFKPDGTRVEIWGSGQIPNRLLAMTGNLYGGQDAIEDRQQQSEKLLRRAQAGEFGPAPRVETPVVWRDRLRAPCDLQTGDVRMLIDRILSEGNTIVGAAPCVGKTWFSLSISKALVTGMPFLGMFKVPEPVKVLYLIPEQGDRSLRSRVQKLGIPMDGSVFRCATMRDGLLTLGDPALVAAVEEWHPVVVLDTAIRFAGFKDENSSAENSSGLFAGISELMRLGALGVISNNHIAKRFALNDKGKLPLAELENLRGTSDLGAMADTVWMLQPDDGGGEEGWLEESRDLTRLWVTNVKPREFDPAEPFRIQGRPHIDQHGDFVVLTDEEARPGEQITDVGEQAARLIAADPRITKAALTKALGVSRSHFADPPGWRYVPPPRGCKSGGHWEPKEEQELGI